MTAPRYDGLGYPTRQGTDERVALSRSPARAALWKCAVRGCDQVLALPRYFACDEHWDRLPEHLQRTLWEHFTWSAALGNADPDPAYAAARAEALEIIAQAEEADDAD